MDRKSLLRSGNDRRIAGVCGGLASYFGWDSRRVRLVFWLSNIFGGAGVAAYAILWLVMPRGADS